MGAEREQWILAFDDPTEGKEGQPSKNGGAPSVRVPLAVLSGRILPLIPEGGRIRVHCVWWVVMDLLVMP